MPNPWPEKPRRHVKARQRIDRRDHRQRVRRRVDHPGPRPARPGPARRPGKSRRSAPSASRAKSCRGAGSSTRVRSNGDSASSAQRRGVRSSRSDWAPTRSDSEPPLGAQRRQEAPELAQRVGGELGDVPVTRRHRVAAVLAPAHRVAIGPQRRGRPVRQRRGAHRHAQELELRQVEAEAAGEQARPGATREHHRVARDRVRASVTTPATRPPAVSTPRTAQRVARCAPRERAARTMAAVASCGSARASSLGVQRPRRRAARRRGTAARSPRGRACARGPGTARRARASARGARARPRRAPRTRCRRAGSRHPRRCVLRARPRAAAPRATSSISRGSRRDTRTQPQLRLDCSAPTSPFSHSATDSPRSTSSSAVQAPAMPAPTTTTSTRSGGAPSSSTGARGGPGMAELPDVRTASVADRCVPVKPARVRCARATLGPPSTAPRHPPAMPGPLHGIRIVDLSSMVSGPHATMLLADQGAEVIKVENPRGGDHTRGHPNRRGGFSAAFLNNNRGKRSVAIDLKSPAGLGAVLELARGCDVFVQNFRPGVAERGRPRRGRRARGGPARGVRLDQRLRRRRALGRQAPVYDPLVQAVSGLASIQGRRRRRPAPARAHHRARQAQRRRDPRRPSPPPCSRASEACRAPTLSTCACRCSTPSSPSCGARTWPGQTFVGDETPQAKAASFIDLDLRQRRRLPVGRRAERSGVGGADARARSSGLARRSALPDPGAAPGAHRRAARAHPGGAARAHRGRLARAPGGRGRAVRPGAGAERARRAPAGARPTPSWSRPIIRSRDGFARRGPPPGSRALARGDRRRGRQRSVSTRAPRCAGRAWTTPRSMPWRARGQSRRPARKPARRPAR